MTYTDDEVAALSFEEKCSWIRHHAITAARHFQYQLNTFFNDFLKSPANPLGEIVDHALRIKFQAWGSPHAHCFIGLKMPLSMMTPLLKCVPLLISTFQ